MTVGIETENLAGGAGSEAGSRLRHVSLFLREQSSVGTFTRLRTIDGHALFQIVVVGDRA